MATEVDIFPGHILDDDEEVTREKLNLLGKPTIDVQGAIGSLALTVNNITDTHLSSAEKDAITSTKFSLDRGDVYVGNASGKADLQDLDEAELLAGSAASKAEAVSLSGDMTLAWAYSSSSSSSSSSSVLVAQATIANDAVDTTELDTDAADESAVQLVLTEDIDMDGAERIPIINNTGDPISYVTSKDVHRTHTVLLSDDVEFSYISNNVNEKVTIPPAPDDDLWFDLETGNVDLDHAMGENYNNVETDGIPMIHQWTYAKQLTNSDLWIEMDFALMRLYNGFLTKAVESIVIAYGTSSTTFAAKIISPPKHIVSTDTNLPGQGLRYQVLHCSPSGYFSTTDAPGNVYISVWVVPDVFPVQGRQYWINKTSVPGQMYGDLKNLKCTITEVATPE